MKSVLAFGDSLTWGSDPATGGRHPHGERWPNVLGAALGPGVSIATDALRGRTTVFDDWSADCDRNGSRALRSALYAHAPLDLVILMLGTNDMKPFICGQAAASARGMGRLVEIVRRHDPEVADRDAPDVLIVAPPPLVETAHVEKASIFNGSRGESINLSSHYRDLADDLDCGFFDASSVAEASVLDGVHMDGPNTVALGQALAPIVRLMLGL